MIQQPSLLLAGYEIASPMAVERRSANRTRTVFRIARVCSQADEGLARIRNISDTGMRLTIGIAVTTGDTIEIWLSDTVVFAGRVVWMAHGECGVQFIEWIDSVEALRLAAEDARLGKARPPRLSLSHPVAIMSERGLCVSHLYDVSQRGMKIGYDGSFSPGLAVKVMIGPGVERRGIVRWSRDNLAGVILTEPFQIQELGSASAL